MDFDVVKSEQLQEMRQQHIGRLLQQAFRGFNNRAIAKLRERGHTRLTLALEKRGYIERRVDPLDRRATLVLFTSMGWQFLRDAYEIKREIEAEYQVLLGEEELQQLRATLKRLLEQVD